MKRALAAVAVLALFAGCGPEQTTTNGTVTVTGEGSPVSSTPTPSSPGTVCASNCSTSGACSGHDGVNCSAGPDGDGSVICSDGWTGSSVTYHCN